ncbi:1-aminocyclopropane-1-carboxylate deaminase/D-cysteine desulfhydrase [Sediminicola sp. 1XM1-17]|uniref:1-aminocyclopropane-1-carboxylate deaminase/D-cysteine desulfhydrase n=1 Tax=Sediminicola sp. 1XM1-17 TaxID=3127702 RepID=UPI0030778FEE
MKVYNQQVELSILKEKGVALYIKREDLIHPFISGNKFRKLTYNLKEARYSGFDTILTFGGAFSNHIAATAYAGKEHGFKTIGIIRGEELHDRWQENPTLLWAKKQGMEFKFITRQAYRHKESPEFLGQLKEEFGLFYALPEGGANALAVKGCEEILTAQDAIFDVICACVGTGGTIAGLINAAEAHQKLIGFPALKGDFLKKDICKFAPRGNWELNTSYHFGGYGKVTLELIEFMNAFKLETSIPLDPVYTGKMLYGIIDLVRKDHFKPNTNILAIHTGGLQGIAGMNLVLEKKNLPLIEL